MLTVYFCCKILLHLLSVAYGPAVIDHCLQVAGFPPAAALSRGFDIACDLSRVLTALVTAEEMMGRSEGACRGYIIQKVGESVTSYVKLV